MMCKGFQADALTNDLQSANETEASKVPRRCWGKAYNASRRRGDQGTETRPVVCLKKVALSHDLGKKTEAYYHGY